MDMQAAAQKRRREQSADLKRAQPMRDVKSDLFFLFDRPADTGEDVPQLAVIPAQGDGDRLDFDITGQRSAEGGEDFLLGLFGQEDAERRRSKELDGRQGGKRGPLFLTLPGVNGLPVVPGAQKSE